MNSNKLTAAVSDAPDTVISGALAYLRNVFACDQDDSAIVDAATEDPETVLHDLCKSNTTAREPGSESRIARAILLLLSDQPLWKDHIRDAIAESYSDVHSARSFDPTAIGALITVVVLALQTHVHFRRDPNGRWNFELRKPSASAALVNDILSILKRLVSHDD